MAVADVALKRANDKPEAAALVEVIKTLRAHPAVAWCERANSGAARIGSRFGWPGCSDILAVFLGRQAASIPARQADRQSPAGG